MIGGVEPCCGDEVWLRDLGDTSQFPVAYGANGSMNLAALVSCMCIPIILKKLG